MNVFDTESSSVLNCLFLLNCQQNIFKFKLYFPDAMKSVHQHDPRPALEPHPMARHTRRVELKVAELKSFTLFSKVFNGFFKVLPWFSQVFQGFSRFHMGFSKVFDGISKVFLRFSTEF
jgi:hypothetical protein